MNSQTKFTKLLLMIGALMLFGIGSILPGIKSAQSLAQLHNASPVQVADQRAAGKEKKPRPDRPDEAARFRRLQMQDEKGFIPPDGIEKARQHTRQMRVGPQGTIRPDTWSWIGPGNIGGRIRSIVIHPTNTNLMWVGSVAGGIWRTDNGGDSWQPVNDFIANMAVSTMIIDPIDPSIMYAGTGEGFGNIDALQGAGILKSTDGGLSWNLLPSTNPATPTPLCPAPATCPWFFVNRLAVSPTGNILLAATNTGIMRSVNSGATWTQSTATQAVDLNFRSNTRGIAGELGAARFTTDGGLTWTAATFNPAITNGGTNPTNGRVELEYNQFNPDIVYAVVNQNSGDVYRSTNGGQNYTRVNTGNSFLATQGWYDNILWVKPQDPNFVIVGGIDLWRGIYDPTTQALNLSPISKWQDAPATSVHADHHAIVAHPGFNNSNNRTVFFGNDGGIYRTDNIDTVAQTSGWVNQNNSLGITQFYGAAGNFINDAFGNPSPVIVGGTQDNGTLTYSGATNWGIGNGGDGGYCAADPIEQIYYGELPRLRIVRSMTGSAFGDISAGITDANNCPTPTTCAANFIAPFILDPNDSNRMLAGGLSLWRSTDVKSFVPPPTWTQIKPPVIPPAPPNSDVRISAIVVSPITSNLIVVGHNNGEIYRTFNGTANPPTDWAKIDTAALPNRMVTRLTIDSTRSTSWIYATFGGFSADNVYRTTDNGTTWTDITGTGVTGLPDVPVRSLVYHPNNPNLLYVGTEIGIFTSDDAGATWELPHNGPANVSVDELFWMGGDLIAATHGRGLYRASGGIYVDCNWNGPFVGTFDQPFKTLTAALIAATTYRTIWLKPCLYNEPAMIDKRVELRSLGGTAVIRKP